MASASVSAAAGLDKADCLGSVGRRWANSPITAHPKRRMHGIPLRVVPRQAEVAQSSREEESGEHPCDAPARIGPQGTLIVPRIGAIRLAGIKANPANGSRAATSGQATNGKIKTIELTCGQNK